ncbi:MAG: methyltransferase [Geminicoccaceae bacterium]|nr:methyltransferase [Geminicoccaceae bacterium]MCE3250891.1 methyltransferase [Geminicoccaceae bacterium]
MPEALSESLTEDSLLGGRVRLSQPARGYRAAIDPVLLAAAVPATAGETVLDAGAGTGAASLALAVRVPGCRIVGLEIQRDLQRLASRNARQNELGRRVEVIEGDLGRPPPRLAGTIFDHVMTNPPHLAAAAACASPVEERARAHVEHQLELAGWLAACLRMLRPGGVLTLVHRADRLADALAPLRGPLGDLVIYPLWPGAGDRPAKRVLVQGRKGRRGPLRLARGLVLHDASGGFSAAAEAVLRHARDLVLLDPRNGSGDG